MKRITGFLLAIVLFAGLVLTGAPTAHAESAMGVSDALIGVLKKEEGFSAKPYWDYGQYTVGYGTRCPDDMLEEYQENGISEKEAETLLRNYLSGTESVINKKFIDKYGLTLTQGQFDALVTFTYNVGSSWITDTSGTFHNAVKNGVTGSELIRAFSLWCNAGGSIQPGLVRRRLCEANMYLNGEYSITKPSNYCYVYYNANGGSVSYRIQGYDANEGVDPAYTPTYSGYTFQGWYTAQTGGEKVTKLTQNLSGTTLYARWDSTETETETLPTEGVTVQVTGSDVNLRKGPGTNYTIVGTANKGDEMVITETASGSGYEWGRDGEKWIALQYTNYAEVVKEQEKAEETTEPTETTESTETTAPETTVPETTVPETTVPETTVPEETTLVMGPTDNIKQEAVTPASTKVTGTVKASGGLAVRKGPSTGYAVVRYLSNGTAVTVKEQMTVGSMTWGRISDGWISMSYVTVNTETTAAETTVPEATVPETTVPEESEDDTAVLTGVVKVNDALSVRKGPGTSYTVVKYLSNGTKVTITEVTDVNGTKWGKISDGWICMDYVVLDNQTEETAVTKTVTADCLNVRESASTSAKIVGYYYKGAKVTILETTEANGTTWGRTSKGWISMDYVE